MKKKILISIFVLLFALISVSTMAIVFSGKEPPKADPQPTPQQSKDVVATVIYSNIDDIQGKYVITVNEKGYVASEISYGHSDGNYTEYDKCEYEYNENGDKTLQISYYWNEELNSGEGDWVLSTKHEYSYATENGNSYITDTAYEYESEWIYLYKEVQGFDSQGRDVSYEYRSTDYSTKYVYTYNPEASDIMIGYEWDQTLNSGEGDWVQAAKSECTTNGKTKTTVFYGWNGEEWTLIENKSESVTYDDNGNILTEESMQPMSFLGVTGKKHIYTYNANNVLTLEIIQEWRNGEYVDDEKYEYSYNENGKQSLCKRYEINNTEWELTSQTTFEYDSNNRITERKLSTIYGNSESINELLEITYSNNHYFEIDFESPIFG